MNSSNNLNKKARHLLSISITLLMSQAAMAATSSMATTNKATPSAELDTIFIEASTETKKPAVETKEKEQLNEEMVANNKDLVRYSIDVGLADSGSRNQKGFSMRGVEANRVGISFDGISIPTSEENSLYSRYSNYNSSRISIDPEIARSVDFVKSSDSFGSGSGAIGGSVNYRSVDVNDIVDAYEGFGGTLRSGYASQNDEWFTTLGLGYIGENSDVMLQYTRREGHEFDSAGKDSSDDRSYPTIFNPATARRVPDEQDTKKDLYLFKANTYITPNHKVGLSASHQESDTFTNERSYALFNSNGMRQANDISELNTGNIYYQWLPDSYYLDAVKLEYDRRESDLKAVGTLHDKITESNKTVGFEKNPYEIKDRAFSTELNQVAITVDSQPLTLGTSEHKLSFRTAANQEDFEVLNKFQFRNSPIEERTIQYPTETTRYIASLKDDIQWSDKYSSHIGVRYENTNIEAKDLNAPCIKCTDKPESIDYDNWSATLGLDAKLNDTWSLGYQASTGYRVPTASELFFEFDHPAGNWKPNPDLKPEESLNHTITLSTNNEIGTLDASLYHTDYKNFIYEGLSFEEFREPTGWYTPDKIKQRSVSSMSNTDDARVSGIEIAGKLNLDKVLPVEQGWSLLGSVGYAKGKLNDDYDLLAVQPVKAVLGLDFDSPDNKWGISQRLRYMGAKKAQDTNYPKANIYCAESETVREWDWNLYALVERENCLRQAATTESKKWPYVNDAALVYDISGYYKPTEALTLRAGVYNLLNEKYQSWDALRGIELNGTSNAVDDDGVGLARYFEPGRNFAVSAEYKF
ncbi:TonB-dependent hemoglobin/transferrin/lactoferrin family receptor [Psychrobacter sp. HD31]|uniref:TonB-dependent hemoglobin/transferrin/lactoferrin family receptor n=1 Tax=Psychrobacter sp. HD31 TaxID=3112003 RepID=UPI003DA5D43D